MEAPQTRGFITQRSNSRRSDLIDSRRLFDRTREFGHTPQSSRDYLPRIRSVSTSIDESYRQRNICRFEPVYCREWHLRRAAMGKDKDNEKPNLCIQRNSRFWIGDWLVRHGYCSECRLRPQSLYRQFARMPGRIGHELYRFLDQITPSHDSREFSNRS